MLLDFASFNPGYGCSQTHRGPSGNSRALAGVGQRGGPLPIAAITRLRLRSLRFAPLLFWRAFRSLRQARAADGCLASDARTIKARVFWTRTLWRDAAAMRAYMTRSPHRGA